MKYTFLRLPIMSELAVTDRLNLELLAGWKVVSHASFAGAYTFVLVKAK